MPAPELAQHLGISRAGLRAQIEELRALGYEVEASPHQGYRLLTVPDLLHADDLLSLLAANKVVGRDIHVFQETSSTNDVLEKLARDGVREGVVVFAETQTQGRGRLGRKWFSPARKGLWFSVLLRPDLRPQAATQLTVAAAASVARAIRRITEQRPEIKWPNDVLLHGKKVAGLLTELSAELDQIKYVILGIGVNVNLEPGDFSPDLRKLATSIKMETGRSFRRAELAVAILQELDRDYALICRQQFSKVSDEWESQCSTLNRRVSIRVGERLIRGQAESLDEDGALLVRTEHGRLERVIGGDVTLEK